MNEIGHILKEARENQELSHQDVFDVLRIQPKFLKAIEDERWEAMPSPAHVRGYVRKYAQHLKLDPNPILSQLASISDLYARTQQLQTVRPTESSYPIIPPQGDTGSFFNPVNAQDINQAEGPDWTGRIVILAIVITLGLLGWRFLPSLLNLEGSNLPLGSMESLTETVNDLLAGETAAAEEIAEQPSVQVSEPITTTELIVPTSRTNGSESGIEGEPEAESAEVEVPVLDPTRNPLPATLSVIDMEVEIIQNRTWIRVVVDGITMFEGQTDRGEIQNYTATESVNIRTGNGAGVLISINEIDLGRLGERGEVIDQTWETTQ
ncbi:MAG: RodZ domain-containing protein [Chloroflexota bacterium]